VPPRGCGDKGQFAAAAYPAVIILVQHSARAAPHLQHWVPQGTAAAIAAQQRDDVAGSGHQIGGKPIAVAQSLQITGYRSADDYDTGGGDAAYVIIHIGYCKEHYVIECGEP
jgi:hypothetical protein